MSRLHVAIVVSCLALNVPATAQDTLPETEFYPMKKGTTWTYKSGNGKTVVVRVAAHEPVGVRFVGEDKVRKVVSAKLETVVENMVVATEHLTTINAEMDKVKHGVYRVGGAGVGIDKPVLVLPLPPKKGESWKVDSKIKDPSGKDETLSGTFTLEEKEVEMKDNPLIVEKTMAYVVAGKDLTVNKEKIAMSFTFVKDLGLIHQSATIDGIETTLTLTKFEAGKGID